MVKLTKEKLEELKIFFTENKDHIKETYSMNLLKMKDLIVTAKTITENWWNKKRTTLINEWLWLLSEYNKVIYSYRNTRWYIPTDTELNEMNRLDKLINENFIKVFTQNI